MISVSIDDAQVQRSLNRYRRNLSESASLMRRLSFDLRNYVRETMKLQGRKRPWAPLANMTMLRTGRRKPLVTLQQFIKSSYTPSTLSVYFENPKGETWTIQQHHTGYTVPAKIGRQGFYAKASRQPIFFMFSKAHKVPAREIIPTKREVDAVVSAAVRDWVHAGRDR